MQPDIAPDPGGYPPPNGGWRWEATGASACVPLYVGWLWLTNGNTSGCGQVLLAVLLGTGIGLAVSGCRRGSPESRWAARVALRFHLVIAALTVGYTVWVRWFDGW